MVQSHAHPDVARRREDVFTERDPVPGELRLQLLPPGPQIAAGGLIGLLDYPATGTEAEDVAEEQVELVPLGLEEQHLRIRVPRAVRRHPDLEARVDQGADGLTQHRGEPLPEKRTLA